MAPVCSVSNKAFTRLDNLRVHVVNQHPDAREKSKVFNFVACTYLKSHVKSHQHQRTHIMFSCFLTGSHLWRRKSNPATSIEKETNFSYINREENQIQLHQSRRKPISATSIEKKIKSSYINREGNQKIQLHQSEGTISQCLMGFSLVKNTKKLISLDRAPDDIECIHGIRTLNAIMLLISHKSMALFFNPYINRTQMASNLGKQWTVVARAASLYTDPFIMLSGLLTSYAFLRQFEKNKKINVVKEIVSRCFRLLPTLGALILFCTFILPFLGSGPQWNLVVSHHATICKQYWWRNMLFIHNYFGFKDMCLTHTHHVGIDTQLFFVSPLLIYMVWKWPRNGFIALAFFSIISTIMRFVVTYNKQLSLFIYFGNPVSKMFDTADYSYILPTHRLTVYAMGIALGYLLRHCGRDFSLKSSHITLGWCMASGFLYQSVFIPSKMGDINYKYDRLDAANYAAFAPITWCLVFMWFIFLSYTGNAGFLGRLASWRGFLVFTRISYTFYLTQFPLFFYNVGSMRGAQQYSFGLLVNLKENIAIVAASVILTLFFEMPFQNIRTALLKSGSKPALTKQDQSRLLNNNNNNTINNHNIVEKKKSIKSN